MKIIVILILLSLLFPLKMFSQEERKHIRKGVKNYNENEFENAELDFRKALDLNNASFEAQYNTGNTLYKQDKPNDAAEKYSNLLSNDIPNDRKADLYYNIGNTYLKSQEYQKSIEAFKNTLRLRPGDDDARYNLAWALSKLDRQQQNQNQDQNHEEKNDEEEHKQDQQQNTEGESQDQPMEAKNLSKEEIERILQALEEKEQQVKEKVDKEKAKTRKTPAEKDW
jgi:Ca-activated chloride channel homolog